MKTATLLEDNTGKNLDDLRMKMIFLNTAIKDTTMKEIMMWTSLKYKTSTLWKTLLEN